MSGGVDNERSSSCGGGGTCSSRCEMGRSCGVDARPRTLARMCGGLEVAVGSVGRGGYLAAMDAHTSALPKCRQKRCTRLPCGPAHWRGRKAETRLGLVCRWAEDGAACLQRQARVVTLEAEPLVQLPNRTNREPRCSTPHLGYHIPNPRLCAILTETRPPAHALSGCWSNAPTFSDTSASRWTCMRRTGERGASESTAWAAAQRRAGGACVGAPTRATAFVNDHRH